MTEALPALAVTFDFGQTLCELDTAMLSRRLAERGVAVAEDRLEAAVPEAWRAYDAAIQAGAGGHPWKLLMTRLVTLAMAPDAPSPAAGAAVDWLWTEQPTKNLWRRPIAGMIEIARSLRAAGVPVGVVSNSEGRLAELVAQLGWQSALPLVADSGKLGMEKPDAPIFHWAAERLGVPPERVVHVGDSWAADVEGALRAGMRAIWFRGRTPRALPPEVCSAEDAEGVRAALGAWGITHHAP